MSKNTPERRQARQDRKARAEQALREKQAAERRRRMLTVGGVVLAVLVVIGGLTWWQSTRDTTGEVADNVPSVGTDASADNGTPASLDGYGIFVGDADAAHTITVYEDLQCPACADFEAQLGGPISDAVDAGKVRLEYRMISFLDRASTNDYSSRALNAALVVLDTAGVEAFRTFHDDLYANQPEEGGAGFTDDELIERAVAAGATEADVRQPIEDKIYDQWIQNATDEMSRNGYNSTPTILIDGEESDPQDVVPLLQ
jgi:protein-disulfide isomerase